MRSREAAIAHHQRVTILRFIHHQIPSIRWRQQSQMPRGAPMQSLAILMPNPPRTKFNWSIYHQMFNPPTAALPPRPE
jgi:hypothetical protein